MRLQGGYKVRVQLCDQVVVVLLLVRVLEDIPGQVINIPGVREIDVGESQTDGSPRLGKGGDMQIRSQRYRGSDRRLRLQVSICVERQAMLSRDQR